MCFGLNTNDVQIITSFIFLNQCLLNFYYATEIILGASAYTVVGETNHMQINCEIVSGCVKHYEEK